MNRYIFSIALLVLLISSCSSSKQLSRNVSATADWSKYNTFGFNEVNADSCPAVIAPSTIQIIETGIVKRMDAKGIDYRALGDLNVNLTFRFGKDDFVNDRDMNEFVKSLKYQSKSYQKWLNYYMDGIVMMTLTDPDSGEELFMSIAKGFVNKDGSEIIRGVALEDGVSRALFNGFPKTGKISIAKQKKIEEKRKYKEERKRMNDSYKAAVKAEREAFQKTREAERAAREAAKEKKEEKK
ncbi:MAG: DUF4136 domain-containing protein [Bacteroidales bacterium]